VRDGHNEPALGLLEVPEPQLEANEALVEVRASAVNRGELALLRARPDGWRPGQDVAGVVVEAAAGGEGPPVGARVVGLVEGAGWSQRVAVPVPRLATIDDAVSFETAVTLGLAGLTALRALRLAGPLLGRRVLVIGASGGLGHLSVQLAALAGARVSALVRTPAHASGLMELGAEDVIAADEPDAAAFDVVLDGVGGAALERAVRAVRPGGTILLLGATEPEPAKITLLDFIGHEGARILTYFSYASGEESTIGADLATLAQLVSEGRLRPVVGLAVDWLSVDHVIDAMTAGTVIGKAVLTIGQT
jgi:NADPH:quinone reductase-like Zn-dependent oxidoreductase